MAVFTGPSCIIICCLVCKETINDLVESGSINGGFISIENVTSKYLSYKMFIPLRFLLWSLGTMAPMCAM